MSHKDLYRERSAGAGAVAACANGDDAGGRGDQSGHGHEDVSETRALHLVRSPRACQPLPQVAQNFRSDVDSEGIDSIGFHDVLYLHSKSILLIPQNGFESVGVALLQSGLHL
jgi:hypothetical protein